MLSRGFKPFLYKVHLTTVMLFGTFTRFNINKLNHDSSDVILQVLFKLIDMFLNTTNMALYNHTKAFCQHVHFAICLFRFSMSL